LECVCVVARLADRPPLKIRDLIRADHQRVGMRMRHGSGFLLGEAHGSLRRQLASVSSLVDLRRYRLEMEAQTRQQLATVDGARCENQTQRRWRGLCFHALSLTAADR